MSEVLMNGLLGEFGNLVGLPDLETDEDNRCNMMFDEVGVSFELGGDGEVLYIYSLLGTVPERDAEAVHAGLLHANHAFQGTGGSTLSVDPQTGGIVLIRQERLSGLRLPRFEIIVENFVDVAEQWMKRLASQDFPARPAESSTSSSRPSGGGTMRV